jgi:molybdopterin converting factor subunit 1
MRVELLYFGALKERLGMVGETVELPEGAAVGDLLRILRERTSNTRIEARVWESLAVAVNRQYSSSSQILREGDEVALLPPVSGGSYADGERLASLAETLKQEIPDAG